MKKYLLGALLIGGLALILLPHVSLAEGVTLYNPLDDGSGSTDIRLLIGRVVKGVLSIIGSIAFLMFVYGGVMWMTSAGNPDQVKKGQQILVWTTLGIALIFSAYVITAAVLNAITAGSVTG